MKKNKEKIKIEDNKVMGKANLHRYLITGFCLAQFCSVLLTEILNHLKLKNR